VDVNKFKELLSDSDWSVKVEDYGSSTGYTTDMDLSDAMGNEQNFMVSGELFESESSERTEGGGDFDGYIWVYKHAKSNTFYAWDGWYSSYEGAEMHDSSDIRQVDKVARVEYHWETITTDKND